MLVIFCADPMNPKQVDEAYAEEVQAVRDVGGQYQQFQFEALVNEKSPQRAFRNTPAMESTCVAIYRGWMLSPENYESLYKALLSKGVQLINDPAAYLRCHWLPESYPLIEPFTAKTVWLKREDGLDLDQVMAALAPFQGRPVILKDFVKSQKHYWNEACFIPDSSDRQAVKRVVMKFLELQDEDLAGGLVFREFVELMPLAVHSKSSMPLALEYRVFVLDGRPIFTCNYWEEGQYVGQPPDLRQFEEVMKEVPSRFFTMDIARKADGQWIIVELGDGQVSGLQTAKPIEFYRALIGALADGNPIGGHLVP